MQIALFLGMLVLVASLPAMFFFIMMLAVPARWTMLVLLGAFVFCTIGYSAMGLGNLDDDRFGIGSFANGCFWISMAVALVLGSVINFTRPNSAEFLRESEDPIRRFVNAGTVFAATLAVVLPLYPLYFGFFMPERERPLLIALGIITAISLAAFLVTPRYNANNELGGTKVFWAVSPVAWSALIALSLYRPAIAIPQIAIPQTVQEKAVAADEPACEKDIRPLPAKAARDGDPKLTAFNDLQGVLEAESRSRPDCVGD